MTEEKRLRSLRDLVALDSPPEALFDSIARLASQVCGVPIALMSLVDEQRQWFKANVGLAGINETALDVSFCAHTIRGADVLEIPDATLDSRFAHNPFVTEDLGIRFYAGAPLSLADGERVGTLCVLDRQPRSLDATQSAMLIALAGIASDALAMRRDLILKTIGARTEFDHALARSEERHRALVEGQSELVSLAEADGTLVYVGPAYARNFGLSSNEMLGANLLDHVAEADRDAVRGLIEEVVSTGREAGSENRMLCAHGAHRWVSWKNSLQEDSSGRRLLRSVGRDVTNRRRVEDELRASQSLLARTGKLAGVGGWELDILKKRLFWSEQTRRIHEVDDDFAPDLAGAIEFYAPKARADIERAVRACVENGTPWDLELPMITAQGRPIWARAQGEAEQENGVTVRVIGALADITERKLLELRLAESERFIRQVTDSVPVGIAYVDSELRFQFVNQEHCRRFGKSREEIIGHTREELTGHSYPALTTAFVNAALAGEPQRFQARDQSGSAARLLEHQVIPDLAQDGSTRGLFAVSLDITEQAAAEKDLRDLTAILENTPDYVVQANAQGAVAYMNPAARVFCGLAADEPTLGRTTAEFQTRETNELFAREIVATVRERGVWSGEARVRGADGQEAPVSHMVIGHRDADGRVERYSAVMRDISDAVRARGELQAQTATLKAVVEAIPAMVAVAGPDGHARVVNRAYERWTGMRRAEAVGRPLDQALTPQDAAGVPPWLAAALSGETASFDRTSESPIGARHVTGTISPLRLEDGAAAGFVLVAQDVTEHKRGEARLMQLAQRDPLTGLLNRAGFQAHADALVASGGGDRAALLCVDLDHFKPVNDAHGHPTGDAILLAFAARVARLVRPTDAFARMGGDEFAILLAGVEAASGAAVVANKVVRAANEPFDVGSQRIQIGASVGIAFRVNPARGWTELFERADKALYDAKNAGRGRSSERL